MWFLWDLTIAGTAENSDNTECHQCFSIFMSVCMWDVCTCIWRPEAGRHKPSSIASLPYLLGQGSSNKARLVDKASLISHFALGLPCFYLLRLPYTSSICVISGTWTLFLALVGQVIYLLTCITNHQTPTLHHALLQRLVIIFWKIIINTANEIISHCWFVLLICLFVVFHCRG